ncbi:MAG: ABC transporter permease [Nitrospinota bacterium]
MAFPFRLDRLYDVPAWKRVVASFAAIVVALLISAGFIRMAGGSVFQAYGALVQGALGSRFAFWETIVRMGPLILTGLAAAVAFKARFWNIGGEGQLYAGAMAATWVGITFTKAPAFVLLPSGLIAGALAGAAWAVGPAFLKARFRVDDVVTTLLLNYVIILVVGALLDGPWRNPLSSWPQSPDLAVGARLPRVIGGTRVHLGIPIAFGLAFVMYLLMKGTTFGYELRVLGSNPDAAHFGGLPTTSILIRTAIVSGGLAGLAGVGEVAGLHYSLLTEISPRDAGIGYTGIVIATLGGLHAIGVLLAAFFFAVVYNGAGTMSRITGVPSYITQVIQGVTLLCMLGALALTHYRLRRVERK